MCGFPLEPGTFHASKTTGVCEVYDDKTWSLVRVNKALVSDQDYIAHLEFFNDQYRYEMEQFWTMHPFRRAAFTIMMKIIRRFRRFL